MGFIEDNAPKHVELQRLKALENEDPAKGFADFLGTFTTTIPIQHKSKDLFDVYGPKDLRVLERDVEAREEHYSDEDKETLKRIKAGKTVSPRQKTELLLTWLRPTAAKKPAELARKITGSRHDDDVVTEDGKPLGEHQNFEDQNLGAGDKIII